METKKNISKWWSIGVGIFGVICFILFIILTFFLRK